MYRKEGKDYIVIIGSTAKKLEERLIKYKDRYTEILAMTSPTASDRYYKAVVR